MKNTSNFLSLAFILISLASQAFGNSYSFYEDWSNSPVGTLSDGWFDGLSCKWLVLTTGGECSILTNNRVRVCSPNAVSASVRALSCYGPYPSLPLLPLNEETEISFEVDGAIDPNGGGIVYLKVDVGNCWGYNEIFYIIDYDTSFPCFSILIGPGVWTRNVYQDCVDAFAACGRDFEQWREERGPFHIIGVQIKTKKSAWAELGTIGITTTTQVPPVASFTYSPEKPMVGGNIIFDASDSEGNIVDYEWDFGDGPPENYSVPTTSHVFEAPSKHTVTLTVTDNDGLTDSTSKELDLTLENGDLFLWRDKDSFFGNLGINFWTHVGIYHKTSNMVIEARSAPYWVVDFYPLSDWFFPDKTCVEALRVETSQEVRDGAVDFAFDQIGKYYDLFTLLINGTKNKDDSDGLGWYCTELVWAAYWNASTGGIDLDPDMLAVSPDEIYNSEHTKSWAAHLENIPGFVWSKYLSGWIECPVDLEITDPDGLVLNKQGSQIPEGIYQEIDTDGDGELDDFFTIPEPKEGIYLIKLIPEAGASPTETFTLDVCKDGTTKVLAQDVQVQDIPDFPFVVTTLTSLSADMEIEPETLSLSSKGNWITCYIRFPEEYYIANIDSSTILLNGEIPPARFFAGDEEDIENILMVKFDRSDLQKVIQPGNVELIVTGELFDGTPFECRDTIRVIE